MNELVIVKMSSLRTEPLPYENKAVYTTASVAFGWAGADWKLGRGSN